MKKLIIILIFICPGISLRAQDTIIPSGFDDPFIEWIGQYPAKKTEAKKNKRLVNFILGTDEQNVLRQPVSVMAISPENYFILDQESGAIFTVRDGVGEMTHFKDKTYRRFNSLVGICEISAEKILFTDSFLNKIFYFTPGKKNLGILNDTLQLDRPTGVAYSAVNHQIWVVETNAHRVSVLDENGQLIRRFGVRGTSPGEFNFPTSIWIDDSGKVFIVDALNFRVQILSPEGNVLSIFGKPGDATGSFARPKGIATDSQGNIYVSDALFNTIQIFDMDGNFLYNFGTQGRGEGEFWMPSGIYIDENDRIYVTDTYNARIQIFRLSKGER